MALIPCRECNKEISSEAPACPNCGAPKLIAHPLGGTRCRSCGRLVAPDARVCPTCETASPALAAPGAPAGPLIVQTAKSRGLYIVLGLFLGTLGIHNFYAGYNGRGAIQLIVTLLLGWFIVGLIITGVWALLDICTIKADAKGVEMS